MPLQRKYKDWLWAALFIAPTVIGLYVFYLYPMVSSIFISLTKWNHLTQPEFIGFANYQRLFSDPTIWLEFKNSIFFVLVAVPITIGCSLVLAIALNRKSLITGFSRTVFFLPYVILPVVAAQIWMLLFNSRFGIVNNILGFLGLPQPMWFTNPLLTRFIIVFVIIWANIGYNGVILLAGLQNISHEYYEVCEIEGASWWNKFRYVTLPLVTPQLFYCLVLSIIIVFRMFDYIYIFGKGSALVRENISTMAYGIYERGFHYLEMGYASAEAVILSIIILSVTLLQNIVQKKWVYYE